MLQREIDRLNSERSEATGTLQIEVVHLRDALCQMKEDLADEKARKQLMRDQLTTEVEHASAHAPAQSTHAPENLGPWPQP